MAEVNIDVAKESTGQQILSAGAKEATSQEILSKLASSGGTRFVTPSNNVLFTPLNSEKSSASGQFSVVAGEMFVNGGIAGVFKIRASLKSTTPSYAINLKIIVNGVEHISSDVKSTSYVTVEQYVSFKAGDIIKFAIGSSANFVAYSNLITICGDIDGSHDGLFTML